MAPRILSGMMPPNGPDPTRPRLRQSTLSNTTHNCKCEEVLSEISRLSEKIDNVILEHKKLHNNSSCVLL